jgi:hypothetical protein
VLQSLKRNPKQRRKHKYYIIRIGVTHMREKELSEEHSPSDVKQALAIASKMGGNMTGATAAIEKKRKGLSKHKQVAAVLKRANEEVKEGLGDEAHLAEQDHEVQMARAELYKLAKYAIKLHEMLKGISEREGLEGWVQSKITKSADMIGSVYHHLEYQESPMGEVTEEVDAPKMNVTDIDKKNNTPAYQKMKKGNPRYVDKTTKKVKEAKEEMCPEACCGKPVTECSCGPDCKHCDCYEKNKVNESGLQAHIGNKKYGKAGMDKLRKAGREGGGEEAKGKIKDKILGKKTESYKESLAAKLENVQQQRKAVAEDLAPTKDQLKGKELDALRNKNVAKMDAEDKAAKKAQRDRFAAIKKSADKKGK